MTDYEKQAKDFLQKTKTTFKCKFLKNGFYFQDDTEERDIYKITLTRGEREYTFDFGQSLNDSGFKLINQNTNQQIRYAWQKELNKIRDPIEYKKELSRRLGNTSFIKIVKPKEPTPYDVLASLTKYDPGDFKDFCDSYGYDIDSKKVERTYRAVVNEWQNVLILWNDEELELLREVE